MQKIHIYDRPSGVGALVQVGWGSAVALSGLCPWIAVPSSCLSFRLFPSTDLQFPDDYTAEVARKALEGHAMYGDGHNVVRLRKAAAQE